jgi:hypothetical protein
MKDLTREDKPAFVNYFPGARLLAYQDDLASVVSYQFGLAPQIQPRCSAADVPRNLVYVSQEQ